jgi:hypothetical protein
MFYRSDRGRRDPHFLPIRDYEDPVRLDEVRLDAWAMALGEQPRARYRPRGRPHRGMLADVDFSRAVPAERRPGLIVRLFRLFAGRPRNEASPVDATESGAGDSALGETDRKSYVWVLDRESNDAKPDAPAREKDRSRAA